MSKGIKKLRVVFIGAGGLAWSVGSALSNAGVSVCQIISPSSSSGQQLASKLQCPYESAIIHIDQKADIYFIAVPDSVIPRVAEELALYLPQRATIIHSSGSVSLSVLKKYDNAAVFYPFQTLTRGRVVDLSVVPIFVEATNKQTLKVISSVASAVTNQVYSITSEQRLMIHLAGVIGNNFTNFLIGQSADILSRQGFSMEILKPLIVETVNKAFELSPEKAQTGPAVRNDIAILEKHQEILQSLPPLQRLYALFSELIALKRTEYKLGNDTSSYE